MRILAAGLLLLALCAHAGSAIAAEMTVSAAASLANAFGEIAQEFQSLQDGLTVNGNYAASNPLLKQMEEGAPVDVFASADVETMDKAAAAKVIDPASRREFARNGLVLIVPAGHARPGELADIDNLGKIAIGNPESVPAGRYAKAALEQAELWDSLKDGFILADSVRQVLDYVARGEADAGFVYATDARLMPGRVDVAMPVPGAEAVRYPIAVALTGANPAMAEKFIEFVLSPRGQSILARHGFERPADPPANAVDRAPSQPQSGNGL